MKKRILSAVIAIFVIVCLSVSALAEEETPTEYNNMVSLLMEGETGTVLQHNGGYEKVAQGTLNKLMTVLLTAEEIESGGLSINDVVTVSSNANAQTGAVVWLMPGEEITIEELLKSVIIGNANDASVALAEIVGGNEEEFTGMMNARAFELCMRNTVFKNPVGYDCAGQYSTPYDMALLCRELLKHEFLYKIMNTWIDRVRGGQTEIVNENRLVRTYEGVIGLKASHTEASGYCLALAAERNGKLYIAIVMGGSDEDGRFAVGKELLSNGFSMYKVTIPSFSGEFIKPISVRGGLDRAVGITAERLEGIVVPENGGEISSVVFMPEYLEAPVKKGQKIGIVGFYNGDTLLYETALIAESDVKKITFVSAIDIFLHNLYK